MEQPPPNDISTLHQMISTHFNIEEMKVLCSNIGIDIENIGGEGKETKALNLVTYVQRRRQIAALIEACRKERPQVDWSNIDQRACTTSPSDLDDHPPPDALHVNLFTRSVPVLPDPTYVDIDWRAAFKDQYPTDDQWANQLIPELKEYLSKFARRGTHHIALHPLAHISAGLAFGYVFRSTTARQLWVEQTNTQTNTRQWWPTSAMPAPHHHLDMRHIDDANGQAECTLELSIAQPITSQVTTYLETHHLPIGQRIQCTLPTPPGISNAAHAIAIATHIRQTIIAARQTHGRHTLHLFAAIPIALAVLIGSRLNACEPIQCYEYDRSNDTYVTACKLQDR